MPGRPRYIYDLYVGQEVEVCDKKTDKRGLPIKGQNNSFEKLVSLRLTEYNNPEFELFPANFSTLIVLEETRHKVICRLEPGVRKYWCNRAEFILFTKPKIKQEHVGSILFGLNGQIMRVNSRKKGKRGERKAAGVLQQWTGMEFTSVPQSGGLRWKKTDNICGDIICTDALHRFDFSVEAKNYKEINFEHLLMPDVDSKIVEFWAQAKSDAKRGKKLPILMMRYDRLPADFFFTVISIKTYKKLKPILHLTHPYLYCRHYGFVIMNPQCLFGTDYKKVKKITTRYISHLYGAN